MLHIYKYIYTYKFESHLTMCWIKRIFIYIHMKTKMMARIQEKLSYIMKYEW